MPDFRLTADEVADPTDYLMARRWPGVEWQPEPPTPEVVARGREYACRACHVREGSGGRAGPDLATVGERLTPGWRARFIQDPQALDPRSPMPNLGVGEAEARAIARYLAADAPVEPDPPRRPADGARGAALFRNLGFPGCHPGDAPPAPGGPDLSHAGDKFQPGSLTRFLARPGRVRPGRTARMPDFGLGEPEVRALVAFLMGLRDPAAPTLPERLRFTGRLSAASVEAGRHLASPDFLSCGSCHVGGAPPDASPEDWAPDLALSGQRLQPDWIVRWLLDPQRLAPGIAMPSLFADETSGPEDILEGDEERQVLALRDYILSLGGAGSAANPRPDAAPR